MSKDAQLLHRCCFVLLTLFVLARIAPGHTVNIGSVNAGSVRYETNNFVILNVPDFETAKCFGDAAEKYRSELAVLWLGKTLPDWSEKCPVKIHADEKLGAGGATTFVFDKGEVYGWDMEIQGSRQRILDSVLPHEITHTILATHFRQPVPRWLDEGAATSVENIAEKKNYQRLLMTFLRNDVRKCLPMNRMVALKDYPSDPMPFYAQGYSVVEYLLMLGKQADEHEHRRLVRFIEAVISKPKTDWETALRKHYSLRNLGDLQTQWIAWVAETNGIPHQPITLASAETAAAQTYGKSIYDREVTAIPVSYTNESLKPIPVSFGKGTVIR